MFTFAEIRGRRVTLPNQGVTFRGLVESFPHLAQRLGCFLQQILSLRGRQLLLAAAKGSFS